MTWGSFVDFWLMRELGQEDSVLRNYDVMRHTDAGATHLYLALKRIGVLPPSKHDAENYLPDVQQRLYACGFKTLFPITQIRVRLIAWYNWDRIRKGEMTTWFVSQMVKQARG